MTHTPPPIDWTRMPRVHTCPTCGAPAVCEDLGTLQRLVCVRSAKANCDGEANFDPNIYMLYRDQGMLHNNPDATWPLLRSVAQGTPLTPDDYWQQAAQFNICPAKDRRAHAFAGLAGEAGEVSNLYAKSIYKQVPLDNDAVLGECGDLLWYMCNVLAISGYTLSDAMAHNLRKLRDRYPDAVKAPDAGTRAGE